MAIPFTLVITFTGLVTFVPVLKDGNLESVWALMVNAEDDSAICELDTAQPMDLHSHFAELKYSSGNICTGPLCSSSISGEITRRLKSVDIRLLDVGTPPQSTCSFSGSKVLRVIEGDRPQGVQVPDRNMPCQTNDFSWVADMSEFSKLGKVCNHCLDDRPSLVEVPADRLAARIKLTSGLIQTTGLTLKKSTFKPEIFSTGSYKQTLAEVVELRVSLEDQASLSLCDFLLDPLCDRPEIVTLHPRAPSDTINISLLNEIDDGSSESDPDNSHFLFFYKLADEIRTPFNEFQKCQADVIIPRPEDSDFGDPRCPMSQMKPKS